MIYLHFLSTGYIHYTFYLLVTHISLCTYNFMKGLVSSYYAYNRIPLCTYNFMKGPVSSYYTYNRLIQDLKQRVFNYIMCYWKTLFIHVLSIIWSKVYFILTHIYGVWNGYTILVHTKQVWFFRHHTPTTTTKMLLNVVDSLRFPFSNNNVL